jgi:glutamate 5-kinase
MRNSNLNQEKSQATIIDRKVLVSDKKRIVIKVGTSTITYPDTGNINLGKLEKFVRILINLRNQGKEVIVVSSGSIGVGKTVLGMDTSLEVAEKQACAAVGQGRLMMIYEKLFNEYSQLTAQILLTREAILNKECRENARRTFDVLLKMDVVPIVNENDTISVEALSGGKFGDNDTLSAYVANLVDADLLILMSDINGLYTDDPRLNPKARFIHTVFTIDESLERMAKGTSNEKGIGGMSTKIKAAKIAIENDTNMVIANGDNIYVINDIMAGKKIGTLFLGKKYEGIRENEMAPPKASHLEKRRRDMKNLKEYLERGN